MQAFAGARAARHHRPDARHPLAAGALRRSAAAARAAARGARARSRATLPATDDIEVASRIVHLPLSWDDPATRLAIEKYTQSVRPDAPWCPSNIEFIRRINGLDSDRRRAPHRLRRQLPGAGPGRRLPGRAGRHAARSAPPAGHDQVQPGAHLDAGERRRHRRRVPVRLRHGGPGRLPVRRAAPARCGTAFTRRRTSRAASPGCCASSTRSASIPVGGDELLAFRAAFPRGRVAPDDRGDDVPLRRLPGVPGGQRGVDRGVPDAASARRSSPNASAGRRCRRCRRSSTRPRRPKTRSRRARSPSAPPSPAASGRSRSPPAPASPPAIAWSSSKR